MDTRMRQHGAQTSPRSGPPTPLGAAAARGPWTPPGGSADAATPTPRYAWMDVATPRGAPPSPPPGNIRRRSAPVEPRQPQPRESVRQRSATDAPVPQLDAWLGEHGYGHAAGPSMDLAYADFTAALAAAVGSPPSAMSWQQAVAEHAELEGGRNALQGGACLGAEGARLGASHALAPPAGQTHVEPAGPGVLWVQVFGKMPLWRSSAWFCAMGFVDAALGAPQTYKYLATPNQTWLMGRVAYKGAYGKVHLALVSGSRGPAATRVAIKVQRLEPKYFPDGSSKTFAQTAEAIDAEIATFGELRSVIEDRLAVWDQAYHAQGYNPFAQLLSGREPTQVYDVYTDASKKKVYLAMTLELGSVDLLRQHVRDAMATPGYASAYVTALGTSLGLQAFSELAALHEHTGYVHRDLKLQNMTFNRLGQLKLIDFGLCAKADAEGYTAYAGLEAGSLLSPEMVLSGLPVDATGSLPPIEPVGCATDVHNLAADMLRLISGGVGHSPFIKATRSASGGAGAENDVEGCQGQMLNVEALELALYDEAFRFAVSTATDPAFYLRQAMPLAKGVHVDFFAACFVHAPTLTLLLLDGVRRYPSQRPSAFEMACRLATAASTLDAQSCRAVVGYFANHPNAAAQDAYFARMEHFENLVSAGL